MLAEAGVHYCNLECAVAYIASDPLEPFSNLFRQHMLAGSGKEISVGREGSPVELVHSESFDSKSAAMSREYEIKQLSRRKKERLVGLDE